MKIGNKPDLPQATAATKQAPKSDCDCLKNQPGFTRESRRCARLFLIVSPCPGQSGPRQFRLRHRARQGHARSHCQRTFRVNAEAVADKLLANTEEFLVHARG